MNKQRGLGSLADLAKILEEASNPESSLRENRKENKPKLSLARKSIGVKRKRIIDSKRKLWYEKRLREKVEQAKIKDTSSSIVSGSLQSTSSYPVAINRLGANNLGSSLLESLAKAEKSKPKTTDISKKRVEAWRRKPGDSIF